MTIGTIAALVSRYPVRWKGRKFVAGEWRGNSLVPRARILGHWFEPPLFPMHRTVAFPIDRKATAAALEGYSVLVNTIAEPHIHRQGLERIAEITSGRPVINDPRRVLAMTRDKVAAALRGIDGLIVPDCVKLTAFRGVDVGPLPRILRATDTNDGETMLLAQTPDDVARFIEASIGEEIYSTQFVESRCRDGYYWKFRVRMIDGHPFAMHLFPSREWCVHASNAREIFAEKPHLLAAEAGFLESPLPDHVRRIVSAIHERIGVEVYGIDLGLRDDGEIVFFEANPTMAFVSPFQLERSAATNAAGRMLEAYKAMIARVAEP